MEVRAVTERLPPVAAIRAAMERERALRALANTPLFLEADYLTRALIDRLRWPRDGTRKPWRIGLAMIGGPKAPWAGIGNVVKAWSSPRYCTVWRKVPMELHPEMRQWKHQMADAQDVALAILLGHITDAYP